MKKNKAFVPVIVGLITLASVAISMASITLAWFGGRTSRTSEENLPGVIGLRGYFFSGSGRSALDPYEIVSPIHLYNLSRLQNYGIFTEKTYFRIGHDFDPNDGITNYQCIDMDTGDYVDYLDMGPLFRDNPTLEISPIGSECTPFSGDFRGNGIPVKNLVISGYPEDIGVFGYANYDAVIDGLVCSDLVVKSLGYTKSPTTDPRYQLFNADIDNIFANASYLTQYTNLDFYSWNGASYVRANPGPNPGLKNINSGGVTYSSIDTNVVTDTTIYKGYFVPTYPSDVPVANDPFTYTWSSSSSLITESDALNLDLDSDGKKDKLICFDLDLLANAGTGEGEFNCEENMQVDARLSLIASVQIDGIIYSRVIQSYVIEFHSNSSVYGDGQFSLSIFCTYTAPEDPGHESTNYFHGNNIGFLVGHLDGTMENSYVYNGTFQFNSNDYKSIKTETQTGLVGEIGTNVVNALNPDFNKTLSGEIGVMNFTRIYDGIRRDFTNEDDKTIHPETGHQYINYNATINHGSTSHFDLYSNYLRTTVGGDYIIGYFDKTEDYNTVDFLFNNVIQDDYDGQGHIVNDRGLGVFKIATPYVNGADGPDVPGGNYGDHVFDSMGSCRIINGTPKNKVYFSTAEYDHTVPNQPAWGIASTDINPLRATTLPTYNEETSFAYPFSRDYNYVFELDLSQNSAAATHNYMYNTNSEFLSNYLHSRLIDKYGAPINHGNYRFGFMFRSAENQTLNALSSYMPISQPATPLKNYGGTYYPANSIVFTISNEAGANVSVVGNNANISIYKFKTDGTANNTITRLYTMLSENTSDIDTHRFFTYDYRDGEGGDTSTVSTVYSEHKMGDGGALYAHIFKLPKSEDGWAYAIGSSTSTKANLYYLAVQGQTAGTIDTGSMANIGNSLRDVDFLLEEPVKADYPGGYTSKAASFDFIARFNTALGEFNVNTVEVSSENYLQLEYYNNPQFITYLFGYSYNDELGYYVDDTNGVGSPSYHDQTTELLINVTS